jgi:hypothetical protein
MSNQAMGQLRKVLIQIGKIQDLSGKAKGIYLNDRGLNRADKLIPILDEIFNLCVDIRGNYEPIEDV